MDRSLSKAAQSRLLRIGSRSPLPPWFQAFATLLLIIFAGYIAVNLMIGSPARPLVTATTVATIPTSQPPTSSIPNGPPANGPTTAVENAQQNGSVDITTPAVDLAKRVALAEVTGRTAGIPRAPGSSAVPGSAVPYAGAALQSIEVNTGQTGDSFFSFLVSVSTGPNGATGTYSVNVVYVAGAWKYTSATS
jgi:hypothetical protein